MRVSPLLRAVACLLLSGCSAEDCGGAPKREPSASLPSDPVERALALRDQAKAGVPSWPDGTTRLAAGYKVTLAVDHDQEIIAGTGDGAILRVPKDGGPVVPLAQIQGNDVRGLVVTAGHVVANVYPRRPGGVGVDTPGRVVAVPLAGGPVKDVLSRVDISIELAGVPKGVYIGRDDASPSFVEWFAEPGLDKGVRVAEATLHVGGLAADEDGVVWLERRYSPPEQKLLAWAPGDKAPRALPPAGEVFGYTMRSDRRAVYMLASKLDQATAPGGGTYFEDQGALVAVGRGADPAVKRLAERLANPWNIAVGGEAVCVAVRGPKMEFSKNCTIVAVPREGGAARTIAGGLPHASCLAADATHFYVGTSDQPGIARVPVPH